MCVCIMCVSGALEGQTRVSELLTLDGFTDGC